MNLFISVNTRARYGERRSKKLLSKVNHDYPRTETSLLAFSYREYIIPGNILRVCDLLIHLIPFVCNVGIVNNLPGKMVEIPDDLHY